MRRDGTLILCYHRVAEGVEDPFHLCVRPGNFAAHLEEMSRSREPSTLADVSVPSRRPRVVVTFDDGYRDNLANALPIAESKGVPITVFVTSGILGNHNGFWWDRLGRLLRARPPHVTELDLPVGGRNVRPLAWFVRDQGRPRFGPPPPAAASGDGDRTGTRCRFGAVAGGFCSPGRRRNAHPRGTPPAGGQRHRDDRRPHGRPRSGSGIVRHRSSRTLSLAPRGSWSGRSAGPCRTSRTHSASATTSTIVRSTPCVRLLSTPRAPPSPERPAPRPIPTASHGAWSWTGDGFVSGFRCNGGNSDEQRGFWNIAKWHRALLNSSAKDGVPRYASHRNRYLPRASGMSEVL